MPDEAEMSLELRAWIRANLRGSVNSGPPWDRPHTTTMCAKKIAVRENYIHISHKERCLSIDIVAWTILFVYNRTKYSVFHFLQCIRKR